MELSDGAALVLVSLAGGPQHPAAIIEDVAATAGRTLAVGTLYSVLDRLIGQGLVVRAAPQGRRRPYQLTASGRVALTDYLTSMTATVQTGVRRLAQA